ncbi:response regulator [Paenibacillus tritici]|uniref:response regulator n=1 Tax=Paenibacillus tritici TaxID=1873425 RepID=UPI001BAB012C|nr:response regulator [Paenibacillus tritici]QUL53458.1 response regulator [Paenibacillus tritici]
MYQLLIVDDEIHAVEGIQSGIDWEKLGITAVFSAYTVRQAKEWFEQERIDIMLCDIEMPQATGLELTKWVKGFYPKTETIFLTCHADFKYAQQAIQLGSFDYLLKPVPFGELEKVIRTAIDKINKDQEAMKYSQYGQLWFQHQPLLIERFWQDILNQTIPSSREAVQRAAIEREIPYVEEMLFLPVLIGIQRWHKLLNLRDEKILEYGLRNSAEELLLEAGQSGRIITLSNRRLLIVLSVQNQHDLETMKSRCEKYIKACSEFFYCDLSCYIGEEVRGHELLGMVNKLYKLEQNNVVHNNKVFSISLQTTPASTYKSINMTIWSVMLTEGAFKEVLIESSRFLKDIMEKEKIDASFLRQFYQDFQQMVYYVLQTKGIQAHQLFGDPDSQDMSATATRSVVNLLDWMSYTIQRAKEYVQSIEQSQSVIEKVIHFIKLHITEDLSREEIANHVFLNPDYLTRVFKKETGMAISDYLLNERLKIAKELLEKTEMPISAIATHIGYANFSHFSRTFKKHTNMNPNEYRQILHRESGEIKSAKE